MSQDLLVLILLILIHEALNAAFSVDKLVLTGEEGVAAGADFDFDIVFGGARFHYVAAGAAHGCFVVHRMNALFHKKPQLHV